MKSLINPSSRFLFLMTLFSVILLCMLSACKEDEPGEDTHYKTSILLYAVASNNLNYNFNDDFEEIRRAGSSIDLNEADVIIYSVQLEGNPELRRMVKNPDDTYGFRTLITYDRDTYSTDPRRISQVIADYTRISNSENRGLILWSHGSGWTPKFADHVVTPPATKSASDETVAPMLKAFGQDKYNNKSDYCDIIELAEAIPSSTFNYIWFDCCYMSSIEVLYQLRDKADFFVGSPNELVGEGMPYHLTLPFLAKEKYSLLGALDAEVSYFKQNNLIFAMALIDASALEDVATEAEKAVTGIRTGGALLYNYARRPDGPFYDFGQYTREWGNSLGDAWSEQDFNQALSRLVIFKESSERDFSNKVIKPENFSGISVHFFDDTYEPEEEYYKTLDWFKRVYTTIPPWM